PAARYVLLNNRAVTLLGQQRHGAAARDLAEAIQLRPERYQAYLTLAQAHRQQGRLDDAARALDQAIAAARRSLELHELHAPTLINLSRLRSRLHVPRGRPAAALADLDAITLLPGLTPADLGQAHRDRGHLLYRAARPAEALQAYTAAVAA